MLKSIYCFLTGQHEFAVTCEPGAIFLQCRTCGQRSHGWRVDQPAVMQQAPVEAIAPLDRRPVAHRPAA